MLSTEVEEVSTARSQMQEVCSAHEKGVAPLALKRKLEVTKLRNEMLSARSKTGKDPMEGLHADDLLSSAKEERDTLQKHCTKIKAEVPPTRHRTCSSPREAHAHDTRPRVARS